MLKNVAFAKQDFIPKNTLTLMKKEELKCLICECCITVENPKILYCVAIDSFKELFQKKSLRN